MKKNNLLKVLGMMLLAVIVLTWIIPAGTLSSGTYTNDGTAPLGIFDIIKLPLSSMANFIQYSIVILLIGGLYGVINKTGVYGNLVNSITKKYKDKEKTFLILTVIFFALLASLTGLNFVLLIIVPFFMTVLLSMKYDRKTVLMATIGSILVGNIASTYGFNYNGYLNYYFSLGTNDDLVVKFTYLIILTFILVMFVLKTGVLTKDKKKASDSEVSTIPLLTKTSSTKKKSFMPLVIIFAFAFIFLLVGMFNWYYAFKTEIFINFYDKVMGFEILGYPIVKNVIGTMNELGFLNVYEMSIIMVILTFVIAWIYNIKLNDLKDSFIDGCKVMFKPAVYVAIVNIIFHIVVITNSSSNIYYTMSNYILGLTSGFNAITTTLFAVVSSFFYNDFTYIIGYMGSNITAIITNSEVYQVIGIIMRSVFGIAMMALPTSMLLVVGLTYLEIPYKEWLKYVWKYLVEVFTIMVVIVTLLLILI
ncbi:MAG: hypothetical protein PHE54_04870 [Bacilli bacterium]|nr:hypothetical protein [Bacilli bacterium]